MPALENSLAQGLSAMQGQGIDPAVLYGMSPGAAPSMPPMAAPTAPAMPQAAPAAAPSFANVSSGPSFGNVQAGTMPEVYGGSAATAPSGVGANPFGVHPKLDIHAIADFLLPRIRQHESTNNYKADRSKTHPGQTASGAYQYIDSTWGGYNGFKRAVDAPPEIQDQRAKEDFVKALTKYGGDPFKAVASHYFPKYAHNPSMWSNPIVDGKGNPIPNAPTVEQYVSGILPKERLQAYLANQGGGAL